MSLDIWHMRDGTPIAVADMETSHVINARNMLDRYADKNKALEEAHPEQWQKYGKRVDFAFRWIQRFSVELKRRKVG